MGLLFTSGSMHCQLTNYFWRWVLIWPSRWQITTCYVFLVGATTISCQLTKQTLVATSSNHVEIFALHEASQECLLLQHSIRNIESSCGFIGHPNYQQLSMEIIMLALIKSRRASLKVIQSNIFLPSFALFGSSMIIISTFNLLYRATRIFLPKTYLHQKIGSTFLLLDSENYHSWWAKTMMMRWGVLSTHACNESCYTYLIVKL